MEECPTFKGTEMIVREPQFRCQKFGVSGGVRLLVLVRERFKSLPYWMAVVSFLLSLRAGRSSVQALGGAAHSNLARSRKRSTKMAPPRIVLASGHSMPTNGLGTFQRYEGRS